MEISITAESRYRGRLFLHGTALFLLGLFSGLAAPIFRNPRMGLSAHLEGVMNGMFFLIVALAWDRLELSSRCRSALFGLLLWAGYANWLACLMGGIFGASRMTPIAGAGFTAAVWQEMLVSGLFVSVGITMIGAAGLMFWGFKRALNGQKRTDA
jgi:hydroxylaminobenzene mutase